MKFTRKFKRSNKKSKTVINKIAMIDVFPE